MRTLILSLALAFGTPAAAQQSSLLSQTEVTKLADTYGTDRLMVLLFAQEFIHIETVRVASQEATDIQIKAEKELELTTYLTAAQALIAFVDGQAIMFNIHYYHERGNFPAARSLVTSNLDLLREIVDYKNMFRLQQDALLEEMILGSCSDPSSAECTNTQLRFNHFATKFDVSLVEFIIVQKSLPTVLLGESL